jgi:hypothetical protein
MKEKLGKIHRETCNKKLKNASFLLGNESEKQLKIMYEKCQCIQIINLINDFI